MNFNKLFKSSFKIFIKTKYCFITYIFMLVSTLAPFVYSFISRNIYYTENSIEKDAFTLGAENMMLILAPVLFIMYIFISFLYFSKDKRDNFKECLLSIRNGEINFLLSKLCVMFVMINISSLLVLINFYIFSFRIFPSGFSIFLYILRLNFYYFFLAGLVAILFGLLCSFIKKPILSYLMIIVFVILTSPIQNYINLISQLIIKKNIVTLDFLKYFTLFPLNVNFTNVEFGFQNSINHLYFALMWIGLLLTIITVKIHFSNKAIKKVICSVSLCAFVTLFVLASLPYSEPSYIIDNSENGWGADYSYYNPDQQSEAPIQYEETANFAVKEYEMDFDVNRILRAQVTVYLCENNLNEYKFTLLHNYKISSIKDSNNNKVPYTQNGDYVVVYPETSTESLTFKYKGYNALYHCNSSSINLPSGLAYYPISGFHYVYDMVTQGPIFNKLDNQIKIKVKLRNAPSKVYSNLEETQHSTFEGISDGLTLVSSFAIKEKTVNNCKVIFYPHDSTFESLESTIIDYVNSNPNIKSIITCYSHSTGASAEKSEYSDHIIVQNLYSINSTPYYSIENNIIGMEMLYKVMSFNNENSQTYKYYQQINENSISNTEREKVKDDVDYIVAEKINTYGYDYTYKISRRICLSNELFDFKSASDLAKLISEETELKLDSYYS